MQFALVDDSIVKAIKIEFIIIETIVRGTIYQIRIKYVFYVPKLQINLVLVSKVLSNDFKSAIQPKWMFCKNLQQQSHCTYAMGRHLNKIKFTNVRGADMANLVQSPIWDGALKLGHRRLRNSKKKGVFTLQNMVGGMNLGKNICPTSSLFCITCIRNKQHRVAISNKGRRGKNQAFKDWAICCMWLHEDNIHGQCKIFVSFINNFKSKM